TRLDLRQDARGDAAGQEGSARREREYRAVLRGARITAEPDIQRLATERIFLGPLDDQRRSVVRIGAADTLETAAVGRPGVDVRERLEHVHESRPADD